MKLSPLLAMMALMGPGPIAARGFPDEPLIEQQPTAHGDASAAARSGGRGGISIVVRSVKPEESDASGAVVYGLTREDYERIIASIPGIRRAAPVRTLNVPARFGDRLAEAQLTGTTPELAHVRDMAITRGRFLADKDVKQFNNVAVIGRGLAEMLFRDEDPIGKSIRIDRVYYLVVGETSSKKAAPAEGVAGPTGNGDMEVYIPLSTMRSRLGDLTFDRRAASFNAEQFELSRIVIAVEDPARAGFVAEAIRRLLKRFHEEADYAVEVVGVRRGTVSSKQGEGGNR